jgi:nucleoside-triphosphatase THEP1
VARQKGDYVEKTADEMRAVIDKVLDQHKRGLVTTVEARNKIVAEFLNYAEELWAAHGNR